MVNCELVITFDAACRPYVYLKEYDVQEPDGDMLREKLRTANRGGCNGDHCHDRTNFISYRFADHNEVLINATHVKWSSAVLTKQR